MADDCCDNIVLTHRMGSNARVNVPLISRPVVAPTLVTNVGQEACEIPAFSRMGVGPVGPQGPAGATGATGPQGPQGVAGANGADLAIEVVAAVDWPPVAPTPGILYLRGE